MSKRDDDSQADMEVGMTTAERRRRRRRGGGLRVPSDNVPRGSRSSTPPVVAPVPEDPSLAMSIAYSFNNDASEPIPRVALDTASAKARAARGETSVDNGDATDGAGETPLETIESIEALDPNDALPMAPEAMSTMIDPPSAPVESADFEMKTREMTAVDLEALGLSNEIPASLTTTDPGLPGVEMIAAPAAAPTVPMSDEASRSSEVEIEISDSSSAVPKAVEAENSSDSVAPGRYVRERKERLKTVALTEEDLEEVREAVRAATQPAETPAAKTPQTSKTMPLSQKDIEKIDEPILGSGEIDIQELSERSAESSGEIEVDVSDDDLKSGPITRAPEPQRSKPPSVPPPILAPSAATTSPGLGRTVSKPPVAPPVAAHKPPTPPPAPKRDTKESPPAVAKVEAIKSPPIARTITEPNKRGKPWFVDLFDEDYLRTLPFLTPQATQAEAEFVIDAMGLQPGAQVLDIGCGYGRHAMELAARGFHVVGLDLSTPLLVRGGEEAHRRGLQINFVRGDMRELDFESQFDGAYCLFSTFGYFDDETNKKTVANIARALKPGGRVLIEILNRDYLISDLPTRVWWEGDGCVVLEEVELNYFSSRIQVNRSVVFDDGRQLEQEISVRAYSLHEVGKLMHAAGFRVLEVSGGYHTRGRFFGNQSRHIIVLAERKEVIASSGG